MIRNLLFLAFVLLQLPLLAQPSLLRNDAVDIPLDIPESPLAVYTLPANGMVSGYHSEGRYRYAGKMKARKLHGNWQSWYTTNGLYEEGLFRRGIPDGSWKVWYENGQLKYLRTYSSDKYHRVMQEFRLSHPRMIVYPITRVYRQNRPVALRQLNAFTQFSPSLTDDVYQPLFSEALLHGPYATYAEDGSLREAGQYSNGLREGLWSETDQDGNTWKGRYQHGLRTGSWKVEDNSGTVRQLVHFRNGTVDWKKEY